MTTQVNSDRTVNVDASLKRFVREEIDRILGRFEERLTRVEVHLSDINSRKTGPPDKRCLVEARPAGARPVSTSAVASRLDAAIGMALRKMQRSLTSFFGRQNRASGHGVPAARRRPSRSTTELDLAVPTKAATAKPAAGPKSAPKPKPKTPAKSTAATTAASPAKTSGRSPKKKAIFQARRKAWPSR